MVCRSILPKTFNCSIIKFLLQNYLFQRLYILGIALATYFLRIQIIVLMRGKRDTTNIEIYKDVSQIMLGVNNNLNEVIESFQNEAL